MGPQDGVDIVVRAADVLVNQLGRDDISFTLIGSGDCFDELVALRDELGLAGHVEFTGRAPDELVSRIMSTADVGLSPDPKNPLNDVSTMNKSMEYMAFELPVVAFDLKETRVSTGDAAVYVTPNDVSEYAKAIAELLDDSRSGPGWASWAGPSRGRAGLVPPGARLPGRLPRLTAPGREHTGSVTTKGRDEADCAELQVRRAHRPRRAGSGLPSGRRPGAVAVLAHLHRHRDDEGDRGQDVDGRQGAGAARPGAQGPGHGGAAGRDGHLQEGNEPARLLHPAGLLAVRRGHRGGAGRRGVPRRPDGRGGRKRVRAARRVQLDPGQPVRAGPAGRLSRARRILHRGCDRHAGRAARRAAARRDRPGHRPRPDRPAGGPAAGRRRASGSSDWT